MSPAKTRRIFVEAVLVFGVTLGAARAIYEVRPLQGFIPVLFLYVPLTIILLRKERPEDYGLALQGWTRSLTDTLLLCAVFFPLFFFFFHLYQSYLFHTHLVPSLPRGLIQWSIFQVLLVALPEEFLYRGYLQSLLNKVYGRPHFFLGARWGMGLLISDGLFALGHVLFDLNPLRFNVFFPGLVFGWQRERGGLLGPVLFHALCNIFVRILEVSYIS